MSALIQLALVQKQLAFWTQLAYNFRHCAIPLVLEEQRKWREAGRPRSGELYDDRRKCKRDVQQYLNKKRVP